MDPLTIVGIVLLCIVLWIAGTALLIWWNACAHYDPNKIEDCRDKMKPWPKDWPHTSGS